MNIMSSYMCIPVFIGNGKVDMYTDICILRYINIQKEKIK